MDATDYDDIEQSATIDGRPATVQVDFYEKSWSRTYSSLDAPRVVGTIDYGDSIYSCALDDDDDDDDPDSEEDGMARLLSEGPADGVVSDPDDGRPAVTYYRPDDSVESIEHWCDGERHDPADGSPAIVRYRPDGSIESIGHWCDGEIDDPDGESPAIVRYHPNGNIESIEHWCGGCLYTVPKH